jgi:hypothetical protein
MGQGSQVEYKIASGSSNVLSAKHPWRIATISAWAVGSLLEVTMSHPFPMIVPFETMTAPKGPPLLPLIPEKAS